MNLQASRKKIFDAHLLQAEFSTLPCAVLPYCKSPKVDPREEAKVDADNIILQACFEAFLRHARRLNAARESALQMLQGSPQAG